MDKPVGRFLRNRRAEKELQKKSAKFSWYIAYFPTTPKAKHLRDAKRTAERYIKHFAREKRRVEKELTKLGGEHPDLLERVCLEDHLGKVNTLLEDARGLASAKDTAKAIDILHTAHVERKPMFTSVDPRHAVYEIVTYKKQPARYGNEFAEQNIPSGGLVINDLPMGDEELKALLNETAPAKVRGKIEVRPFSKAARRVLRHVKALKPDLVILPMRGAHQFIGMLPRALREKAEAFNISEHGKRGKRLEAISKLVDRVRRETPKRVVWLDDIRFTGVQSELTEHLLRSVQEKGVDYRNVVLAAYEPDIGVEDAYRGVPKKERSVPMLASKSLQLLARLALKRGDKATYRRVVGVMRGFRNKGESGWV
jgi:hypoxanthine-guanine phosphoribosyltransferase